MFPAFSGPRSFQTFHKSNRFFDVQRFKLIRIKTLMKINQRPLISSWSVLIAVSNLVAGAVNTAAATANSDPMIQLRTATLCKSTINAQLNQHFTNRVSKLNESKSQEWSGLGTQCTFDTISAGPKSHVKTRWQLNQQQLIATRVNHVYQITVNAKEAELDSRTSVLSNWFRRDIVTRQGRWLKILQPRLLIVIGIQRHQTGFSLNPIKSEHSDDATGETQLWDNVNASLFQFVCPSKLLSSNRIERTPW